MVLLLADVAKLADAVALEATGATPRQGHYAPCGSDPRHRHNINRFANIAIFLSNNPISHFLSTSYDNTKAMVMY